MDTTIKLLRASDVQSYKSLRLKSYKEAPLAFSESYEDESKKPLRNFEEELIIEGNPPEQFILGAFIGSNQLIGFVKFRRDKRSKARHKSMIHAMYVDQQYRRQGIGKLLIDQLLDHTKVIENLEQIHLWVLHSHTSASDFYKKCGFESQGTLVKKDLKINAIYVDAEYMVKYL